MTTEKMQNEMTMTSNAMTIRTQSIHSSPGRRFPESSPSLQETKKYSLKFVTLKLQSKHLNVPITEPYQALGVSRAFLFIKSLQTAAVDYYVGEKNQKASAGGPLHNNNDATLSTTLLGSSKQKTRNFDGMYS